MKKLRRYLRKIFFAIVVIFVALGFIGVFLEFLSWVFIPKNQKVNVGIENVYASSSTFAVSVLGIKSKDIATGTIKKVIEKRKDIFKIRFEDVPENTFYVQVDRGCLYHITSSCAAFYSGPSFEDKKNFDDLIIGSMLQVKRIVLDKDDNVWYEIIKDWEKENTKWMSRLYHWWENKPWYIPEKWVVGVYPDPKLPYDPNKGAVVDLSGQTIYVCEEENLVASTSVSTGAWGTPTRVGTFAVYRKVMSRLMQGWDFSYFVPYAVYFGPYGEAIHCAPWNDTLGRRRSHGCVNANCEFARWFYHWAAIKTKIKVVYNLGENQGNPCLSL